MNHFEGMMAVRPKTKLNLDEQILDALSDGFMSTPHTGRCKQLSLKPICIKFPVYG
jgi:hypothetical protein